MFSRFILPCVAVAMLGTPALAQDSGGLHLAPNVGHGPVGLARPLLSAPIPFLTARDVQNGMTASDHQAKNQSMITALRGDPGFLSGFQFGTPLAASRQVVPQVGQLPDDAGWQERHRHHGHGGGPIIIDNGGPLAVTVGNGNVVQQSSAQGSGPIAQQQIVTLPGGITSGATNLAGGRRSTP